MGLVQNVLCASLYLFVLVSDWRLVSKDASFLEAAVVQLARLYIIVRKVSIGRPGMPAPYEHSGNSVAYPLESHALLRRLGLRVQDLPRYLTVVFEGEDRSVVRGDVGLKVSTVALRSIFRWLLFNCWPWLEATQSLPITPDYFGEDIEETIASYSTGTGRENDAVVPEALIAAALSTGSGDGIHSAQGPADAVASDSASEDSAGDESAHIEKNTGRREVPFHAAVLDTGLEGMSVVQEWNQIVHSCDVMGSIGRSIQATWASTASDEARSEALRKQEALGDAAVALSRLAREDVRAALQQWENHSEDITNESQSTFTESDLFLPCVRICLDHLFLGELGSSRASYKHKNPRRLTFKNAVFVGSRGPDLCSFLCRAFHVCVAVRSVCSQLRCHKEARSC